MSQVHALDRLDELESLPAGWDGLHARPIDQRAVATARRLLMEFPTLGERSLPHPNADGGLMFEWSLHDYTWMVDITYEGIPFCLNWVDDPERASPATNADIALILEAQ